MCMNVNKSLVAWLNYKFNIRPEKVGLPRFIGLDLVVPNHNTTFHIQEEHSRPNVIQIIYF
jgi:hypothetical protein